MSTKIMPLFLPSDQKHSFSPVTSSAFYTVFERMKKPWLVLLVLLCVHLSFPPVQKRIPGAKMLTQQTAGVTVQSGSTGRLLIRN
jgi:hypothetical protein